MSTQDLLGALAQYVLTNDEVSRLALADALKSAGQEEAGGLLGEGKTFFLVEQPDPHFGELDNVRTYEPIRYHTKAEKTLVVYAISFADPQTDKVAITSDEDEARDLIGLVRCETCGGWFAPVDDHLRRECSKGGRQ